jgi:hypothetical protein
MTAMNIAITLNMCSDGRRVKAAAIPAPLGWPAKARWRSPDDVDDDDVVVVDDDDDDVHSRLSA